MASDRFAKAKFAKFLDAFKHFNFIKKKVRIVIIVSAFRIYNKDISLNDPITKYNYSLAAPLKQTPPKLMPLD